MSRSRSKKSRKGGLQRPRRPTFAIVLLVAFIATVFWFILQRQLGSAEERRLRLLAGFADRVEATVGDLGDRFGRVVSERCADRVADYLKLLPQVEYVSSAPADAPCPQEASAAEPEDRQVGEEEVLPEEATSPPGGGDPGAQPTGAGDGGGKGAPREAEPKLTLASAGPHVRLRYQRSGASGAGVTGGSSQDGRAVGTALARLDLASVIEPMIIPGVFDSILLADAEGWVLYQQGEPELRVTHLDGLLGASGGNEEMAELRAVARREGGEVARYFLRLLPGVEDGSRKESSDPRATTILKTRVADSEHSVFLQPVTLRLSPLPDRTAPQPVQWVAVGVISSEHLLSAGVTTSPILLFLLVSILPLGLVAWPFLKLSLISRRQPFTRLDCAFLILACVLVLSFGALLLFDGLFLNNVQRTVDHQLARLSETAHRSFRGEVLDAVGQLHRLNRSVEFPESGEELAFEGRDGFFDYFRYLEQGGSDVSPERSPRRFIESRIGRYLEDEPPRTYPYFDSAFWADADGNLEGANLPLREHAVLPQRVVDREYFQCAKEGDGRTLTFSSCDWHHYWRSRKAWARAALPESCRPEPGRLRTFHLCLQPFLDRTTGEAVTAVSVQGPERWRDERPVAALVTRLTSMTHPVLPPEIRFAVVDGHGRVLFHSDARRALTEDFLKATDENRLLQSLLEGRREGHVPLHYWGQRHRAYVRPMEDLPWTLVVFRSMEDLRLRNFELIYDFLNPFVLSLALLGLPVLLFKVAWPRRFRELLWPTPRHLGEYWWVVWWTLAWVAAFVVLLLVAPVRPAWLFFASLLVGPFTFAFVVFGLPNRRRLGAWWRAAMEGERSQDDGPESTQEGAQEPALREGAAVEAAPAGEPGGSSDQGDGADTTAPKKEPGRLEALYRRFDTWRRSQKGSLPKVALGLGVTTVAVLAVTAWWRWDALAAWLAVVLIGVAWALRMFRFEFWGRRRKVAYVFAVGCLLLLSLLPALGFFHLARSRQAQFLTQDGALSLAQRVRDRAEEIEDRHGPLTGYYGDYADTLACTRDDYLRAVFGSQIMAPPSGRSGADWPDCPSGASDDPLDGRSNAWLWPFGRKRVPAAGAEADRPSGFERSPGLPGRWMVRVFSARPLALNDLSTRPSGIDLSRFHSTRGGWHRGVDEHGRDVVVLEPGDSSASAPLPALASVMPVMDSFRGLEVRRALLLILGLLLLGAAPFLLSYFLADRLLLISLVYYGDEPVDRKGERSAEDGRRVLLVHPGEELDEALGDARSAGRLVKRLVVVSGQLQREAWEDHVGEPGEVDQDGTRYFWEARFREAWKLADSEEATASATDGPPSRARRFEDALKGDAGEDQSILITEFDPALEDPVAAADQSDALRSLIDHGGRSVVILSETVPARPSEETHEAPEALEARLRWIDMLGSFPVRYARDMRDVGRLWRGLGILKRRIDGAEVTGREELHERKQWSRIVRTIREECRHTPTLRQLGGQLISELFVERAGEEVSKKIETLAEEVRELDERIALLTEIERIEGEVETVAETEAADRLETEIAEVEKRLKTVGPGSTEPEEEPAAPEGGEAAKARSQGPLSPDRIDALRERLGARREALPEGPASAVQTPEASEPSHRAVPSQALQDLEDERKTTQKELESRRAQLERIEDLHGAYRTLLTEEHVITRIGAEARLHYRFLWAQCTRDQRLVLVQLAHHGLVNPKYDGWVLDLMQKGLIVRAPDIRLMNRSFERFVQQETRRSQILEWQEELGPNAWGVLKWILPFPLLALAGFLFITQRDAVSNAAGVLVALASLTPVVFNLYDKFQEVNLRHGRSEADGDEGEEAA